MKDDLILETISVTKNFFGDKSTGVNNITIFVPKAKVTAIVGESGSGKTTLLNLLYGTIQPDHGEVFFKEEQVLSREHGIQHAHKVMRMVTQNGVDMNPESTVWDTIRDGLPEEDLSHEIKRVTEALNMLNIYPLKDYPFGKLSGGEKQRVTIAKALISRPQVLLLDEPFNQVDAFYREALQHDIRQIVREWKTTVVLVSHDPAEILSMADELIVIKEGEIVENGPPDLLYHSPNLLYTSQILASGSKITSYQAKLCGIKSKRGIVVIYAENIRIVPFGKKWYVKMVLFKGFYEELIIEHEGVTLRVMNYNRGKYKTGSKVSIKITKYFEFGKWEN
ncbi:ABC transporter ATP-binding protein [Mucilaginibacter flavus]|uniref:ABC transporter ATP-binding protein n=1 Tax=Mucilaginibacter flavus TaxID=931504 RepID=UPI0025B2B00B|nr:ATP-binding cassette domain-containing protein [Mucilaginibacter flavus]MDN3582715.1 ATP-binding cassette domain-containing protein [Mucilaginibacter flavus]